MTCFDGETFIIDHIGMKPRSKEYRAGAATYACDVEFDADIARRSAGRGRPVAPEALVKIRVRVSARLALLASAAVSCRCWWPISLRRHA